MKWVTDEVIGFVFQVYIIHLPDKRKYLNDTTNCFPIGIPYAVTLLAWLSIIIIFAMVTSELDNVKFSAGK